MLCEWNPTTNEAADDFGGEIGHVGCQNEATVSVGKGIHNWHLCEACSALPAFRRFRVRTQVKRASLTLKGGEQS